MYYLCLKKLLMIHSEEILCPHCSANDLQKNGKSITGLQRWHCKGCSKYFQREYRYNAYTPGIREKVIDMTLNGSGVRDTGRVLRINKNTVIAVLKKNAANQPFLSERE
jgi:transposase-like protein